MTFKPGDRVRLKGGDRREFILGDRRGIDHWSLLSLQEKELVGASHKSDLELIQEESMPHPYLTPEKIEQLADAIDREHSSNGKTVRWNVERVLEREANPPPKPKRFAITVESDDASATGLRMILMNQFQGAFVSVEEVS